MGFKGVLGSIFTPKFVTTVERDIGARKGDAG